MSVSFIEEEDLDAGNDAWREVASPTTTGAIVIAPGKEFHIKVSFHDANGVLVKSDDTTFVDIVSAGRPRQIPQAEAVEDDGHLRDLRGENEPMPKQRKLQEEEPKADETLRLSAINSRWLASDGAHTAEEPSPGTLDADPEITE